MLISRDRELASESGHLRDDENHFIYLLRVIACRHRWGCALHPMKEGMSPAKDVTRGWAEKNKDLQLFQVTACEFPIHGTPALHRSSGTES